MSIHTGLVNRVRWMKLMGGKVLIPELYAIMVIDLNGLKQVNDTKGHEIGDQIIFQLFSILRNTLPHTSMICRWSGDEFAVLLTSVNRKQMESYLDALLNAKHTYNMEHPGISRSDLFHLADEAMYYDKQKWYAHRTAGA